MKFIVYNSDTYYPSAEEYDNYAKANEAFAKLKSERIDEVKNIIEYPVDISLKRTRETYFDKDYLCIVLSEIDVDKLKELVKLGDDLDDDDESN